MRIKPIVKYELRITLFSINEMKRNERKIERSKLTDPIRSVAAFFFQLFTLIDFKHAIDRLLPKCYLFNDFVFPFRQRKWKVFSLEICVSNFSFRIISVTWLLQQHFWQILDLATLCNVFKTIKNSKQTSLMIKEQTGLCDSIWAIRMTFKWKLMMIRCSLEKIEKMSSRIFALDRSLTWKFDFQSRKHNISKQVMCDTHCVLRIISMTVKWYDDLVKCKKMWSLPDLVSKQQKLCIRTICVLAIEYENLFQQIEFVLNK